MEALERELSRVRRFVETFGEEVWVSLASITEIIGNWKPKFKSPSKGDEEVSLEDLDKLSQQCDEIGRKLRTS